VTGLGAHQRDVGPVGADRDRREVPLAIDRSQQNAVSTRAVAKLQRVARTVVLQFQPNAALVAAKRGLKIGTQALGREANHRARKA
jgi:hypothetical protein